DRAPHPRLRCAPPQLRPKPPPKMAPQRRARPRRTAAHDREAARERRPARLLRRRRRDAPARIRRRGQPPARPGAPGEGGPAMTGSADGHRPTRDPKAYRDGSDAIRPKTERVVDGAGIEGEVRIRADACVIGTGAGGAPVAKELAEGGMNVVMLEEGKRFTTDDFNARPRDMMSRLYRDAGQVATVGNVPIPLPLGESVGGSTLINSGTCFRT